MGTNPTQEALAIFQDAYGVVGQSPVTDIDLNLDDLMLDDTPSPALDIADQVLVAKPADEISELLGDLEMSEAELPAPAALDVQEDEIDAIEGAIQEDEEMKALYSAQDAKIAEREAEIDERIAAQPEPPEEPEGNDDPVALAAALLGAAPAKPKRARSAPAPKKSVASSPRILLKGDLGADAALIATLHDEVDSILAGMNKKGRAHAENLLAWAYGTHGLGVYLEIALRFAHSQPSGFTAKQLAHHLGQPIHNGKAYSEGTANAQAFYTTCALAAMKALGRSGAVFSVNPDSVIADSFKARFGV